MGTIYNTIRDTFIYASAIAAIMGGFNIFQKWNRGEEVKPLIFGWLYGIVLTNTLVWAVGTFIVGGGLIFTTPQGIAKDIGLQIYSACLIIGLIISIVSLIDIYKKYTDGEEITGLLFRWIGSILFLFFFGNVITAML
jgi:TRAP-type C4-dicarboxylate transport system permease small subunit